MRAVLSARVRFIPTSDRAPAFASRIQIRQALSTAGLTPPPLLTYRWQSEGEGDQADDLERQLFIRLSNVVGAVAKERESVDPDDLLVGDDAQVRMKAKMFNYVDAAAAHIADDVEPKAKRALEGLASFALPVLTRMPAHTVEDRDKRRSVANSLLFASTLTPTRSLFVVSSENEEAVTFRLHHQLIERLQRGCEDLIKKLSGPIGIPGGTVRFTFDSPIEIYEVGQEDPTILGRIIGPSTRSRASYALSKDVASYLVVAVLSIVFIALMVYLVIAHLDKPEVLNQVVTVQGDEFVRHGDSFWLGQAQRLQSGVIPVLLVTIITLLTKYPRGLVISWNQRYSGDE